MQLIKTGLIIKTIDNHHENEIIAADNIKILTFLNQPSFSKSTKENYTRILSEFFSFFSTYGLKDITDTHVTLYLKSLDRKPATRNLVLKAISSFYAYLLKTGYLDRSPAANIKQEKVPDGFRSKILEFEQISRMIEVEESPRNRILLKILYYAGLRISEALSLTPKAFREAKDGGAYMTVLGKGTKVRTIFLPQDIFAEIEEFMTGKNLVGEAYLFHGKNESTPLTRMQAFRIIKSAAKKGKVDPLPSPHWFRHSSATHAIENGAPIHVVQHSLGHASINTTGKYLHATPTTSNANFLKRR
jgi:integrase/recombinase XerD